MALLRVHSCELLASDPLFILDRLKSHKTTRIRTINIKNNKNKEIKKFSSRVMVLWMIRFKQIFPQIVVQ
jgi:hypothetical protein